MRVERAKIHLVVGAFDTIFCNVFGHEIPILVQIHGGEQERVKFLSRGEFGEIESAEQEYDRLVDSYRTDENGKPHVEHTYPGGGMTFQAAIDAGPRIIDGVEKRTRRDQAVLRAADPTLRHQPGPNDDGYLNMKELAEALHSLTGEKKLTGAVLKRMRRAGLKARVVLALEERLLEAGLPVMQLDTDPELTRGLQAYAAHRAKEAAKGEAEAVAQGHAEAAEAPEPGADPYNMQ